MWLSLVRGRKLLENWMSARAAAEDLRARYFEAVTSFEPSADNSSIPLPLLQLEYFRRYQFDVQMAFYERRAADHRRRAARMSNLGAGAVALASISAGLATVLSGFDPRWVSIAALGAIATALSSFTATMTDVSQSRRNSELYDNARRALALLKGKLDDVRVAAADGGREPVKQFVAAVHHQIAAEHGQWLAAAQSIQPSIDKLEEALANLKTRQSGPQTTAQGAGLS